MSLLLLLFLLTAGLSQAAAFSLMVTLPSLSLSNRCSFLRCPATSLSSSCSSYDQHYQQNPRKQQKQQLQLNRSLQLNRKGGNSRAGTTALSAVNNQNRDDVSSGAKGDNKGNYDSSANTQKRNKNDNGADASDRNLRTKESNNNLNQGTDFSFLSKDLLSRLSARHEILADLSRQIPALLQAPLSETDARKTYTDDTRLVVAAPVDSSSSGTNTGTMVDFELASSRDELLLLCNAFVLALAASNRANALFDSALATSSAFWNGAGSEPQSQQQQQQPPWVDTKICFSEPLPAPAAAAKLPTMDSTFQPLSPRFILQASNRLIVEWETTIELLPSLQLQLQPSLSSTLKPTQTVSGRLQGRSELILCETSGKVKLHRLLQVSWNNQQPMNSQVIGKTLSRLRENFKTLQPLLLASTRTSKKSGSDNSNPLVGLFQLGQELLQQQLYVAEPPSVKSSPLYVYYYKVPSTGPSSSASTTTTTTNVNTAKIRKRISLEDYNLASFIAASSAAVDNGATYQSRQSATSLAAWLPLPGSQVWPSFVASHKLVQDFVKFVVPILSSGGDSQQQQARLPSLFAPTVQFTTLDGSLLFPDSTAAAAATSFTDTLPQRRVANFYTFLANLRKRSSGSSIWKLEKATVLSWGQLYPSSSPAAVIAQPGPRVQIDYTTNIYLPGLGQSTTAARSFTLEGTDIYQLALPPESANLYKGDDDRVDISNDAVFSSIQITKVKQTKLALKSSGSSFSATNTNTADSSASMKRQQKDAVFFMKSLATAAESKVVGAAAAGMGMGGGVSDEWLLDLVQKFTGISTPSSSSFTQLSAVTSGAMSSRRSDQAALTVYRIMDSLLRDLPAIAKVSDTSPSNAAFFPPLYEYMDEQIQLRGYLDEVLLRSRSSYERTWRWWMTWLQLAIRTKQLVWVDLKSNKSIDARDSPQNYESGPIENNYMTEAIKVRVELTQKRNVRVFVNLNLAFASPTVLPEWTDPTANFRKRLQQQATYLEPVNTSAGLPFKLSFVSEYMLDEASGIVVAHRLLESRVNGQLTPGDAVARLLKKQRKEGWDMTAGSPLDEESLVLGVLDAINWVRTLRKGADESIP